MASSKNRTPLSSSQSKTNKAVAKPKNFSSYVEKIDYWTKEKSSKATDELTELPAAAIDDENNLVVFDHTREDVLDDGVSAQPDSTVEPEVTVEITPVVDSPIRPIESRQTVPEILPDLVEVADVTDPTENPMPQKRNIKLPGFLSKITLENNTEPDISQPHGQYYLGDQTNHQLRQEATQRQAQVDQKNSFTSIFNKDQDEISSIKRVFRKSIIFMILALLGFGLTSLTASFFLFTTWISVLISSILFVTLANIFFIIVAHRTYIWLFLVGELVLLLITQGFQIQTLGVGLAITLLTYLAYLDLEKIQLGSRLFSIPYIVGECTKLLTTVVILVVSLSVANQILTKGIDGFITDNFLANVTVIDQVVRPATQNITLRSIFAAQDKNPEFQTVKRIVCQEKEITCFDPNQSKRSILVPEKNLEIDRDCRANRLTDVDCLQRKEQAENAVLDDYKMQVFPNVVVGLNDQITDSNYRPVLKAYYQTKVKAFTSTDNLKFLPNSIPRNYIYPVGVALIVFILLSVLRFGFVWAVFVVTWLLWKILQMTGFARIDVEMVEAEIVGI